MTDSDFLTSGFDLNQIRAFVLIYESRSVSAAAERLHLTQPTVSYALQKLRRRFADELFVRTASGLEPTPKATRLYRPLYEALAGIEQAVRSEDVFDPAGSTDRFAIGLSDFGEHAFLQLILRALSRQAPGVRLDVLPLEIAAAERLLSRGGLDAFISIGAPETEQFDKYRIHDVGYAAIVALGHPRVRGSLTREDLERERFIEVRHKSGHTATDDAMRALGIELRYAVHISRFTVIPDLVEATDYLAILPRNIAVLLAADYAIEVVELPFHVEPVEITLHTRRRISATAAQRWFAEFLVKTLVDRV